MSLAANSKSSGTTAPVIHGMIDANVYISSRVTWPLDLVYVLENGKSKSLKEIVNEKFPYHKLGMFTVEMGNYLVNLNTEMYNLNEEGVDNRTQKGIPSMIIATTMDMEFAHLRGYKGETISHDSTSAFQGWENQIEDTETVVALNPLRLFPLFSYDPRRYSLSSNGSSEENICKPWDEPFTRISGCGNPVNGINKIWLGFCMNPVLGFRPFDEHCKHLPKFYEKCEKNNIPILAHCAPGGIIAHGITSYTFFDIAKGDERKEHSKMPNGQSTHSSDAYQGRERVVENSSLNYFYMNYGHPRNWIQVLKYFPDLCLCLSGFGGNIEWQHISMTEWITALPNDQLPPREWIRCIIKLTRYKNVYADISGLDIYNPSVRTALLKLLDLIQNGHKDFEHLKYKLIFGSGWYLTYLMDMSDHTGSVASHSYRDYCHGFKGLFDHVDETGKFWECVSLINPWSFYGFNSSKIECMYDVLAKNTNGNVNCDMLEKMMRVFDGSTEDN